MNRLALVLVVILISTGCQRDGTGAASSATPALAILLAFTAPDVPATGPAEQPVEPLDATSDPALAASLPGAGLAEHPMLYIGEGHNTMLLVAGGKVVWTYSTGKGWEYDDIWLLSNGNVLFSRMAYAAEITPQKQEVWHRDAVPGTEIHSLQFVGNDRVVIMRNGNPAQAMIINVAT
nr:hypothetical protein [Planctomycetota bacterium]